MLQIFPALRQMWRSSRCLQLGLGNGVLLDGLDAKDELLILALRSGISEPGYRRRAGELGVALPRAESLLALLTEARALIPRVEPADADRPDEIPESASNPQAATLLHYRCSRQELIAHRKDRRVSLYGDHELAGPLALRLREAGIGEVITRPSVHHGRDLGADLAVLLAHDAPDPLDPEHFVRADRPHLAIVSRETDAVVGPLVIPGRTACLRCLELRRSDADPGWPLLLAQLCSAPHRAAAMDGALALSVLGTATLQILCHLDGRTTPSTFSASITVSLPDGDTRLEPIPAHPDCGCLRLPAAPPRAGEMDRTPAASDPGARPAVCR